MGLVNYNFVALLDSDPNGQNTVAGQAVGVRLDDDNSYAVIYSDSAGASPISQPGAVTDANGVLSFWTSPGIYKISAGSRLEIVIIDDGSRLQPDTLADAVANVKQLRIGDNLDIKERSSGNGGGAKWQVVDATTVAENGLDIVVGDATRSFQYILQTPISANALGAITGESTAAIQAAIDLVAATNGKSSVVNLEIDHIYTISGAGLEIPRGVTLDCNDARLYYTGTGTAVTLGDSDSTLAFAPKILNMNLLLKEKTSKGVRLRCTRSAVVKGRIEGEYQPFDNTRTNIGVHVDGVNTSTFFNHIEVTTNHIHESFLIESTGTLQATTQYFVNCCAFGDQDTDNTSIGYSFGVGGVAQEGQGSVIIGGNVEKCNTGFLVGANAGRVSVDGVRIEIVKGGGTAWIFDFVDGCDPWTLNSIQGLGSSYMESNNGIRNWDSNTHALIGDEQGSIRLGGFDDARNNQTFLGIGGANPKIAVEENSDLQILTESGGTTDTGRILIQKGQGSVSNGGFLELAGMGHATRAGECHIGGSAGATGDFFVDRGFGGTNLLRIARNQTFVRPGVDNIATLGQASFRWKEIFSVNATINTSDARLKTKVKELSKNELKASKDILKIIGGWKWLAKVEKEGDEARMHYGPTVQAVIKALEDNKIKPFSCSFVCYDKWDDEYRKYDLNEGKLDKDGNPLPKNIKKKLELKAGDRYSLRKTELIMFLLAGINQRLEDLEV